MRQRVWTSLASPATEGFSLPARALFWLAPVFAVTLLMLSALQSFDAAILQLLNGFAGRWWGLDHLAVWLNTDGFQKGGMVMLLWWWVWFRPGEGARANREILLCVAAAAPCAFVLARLLSSTLPFRVRPLHNPELHIRLAQTLSPDTLLNWSSFPSDHAVLFFTFVAGFFLISRRVGWVALAYVSLFICLPRVYLGIHHPTDIVAGAVLGSGLACAACLPAVRTALAQPLLDVMARRPALFHACLFFYTCQVANAFGWVRDVLGLVLDLAGHAAH